MKRANATGTYIIDNRIIDHQKESGASVRNCGGSGSLEGSGSDLVGGGRVFPETVAGVNSCISDSSMVLA